jgi:ABC-type polar amino acid transport system ATPase subunit
MLVAVPIFGRPARIAFLHGGRIHEELPAKEFVRQCAKPETQKFISAFLNRL